MATLSVTNTLAATADILASEHNTNYSDIVTYVNDRNDGSAVWERCLVTDATNVPLIINNSTGTQNIANFQDNGSNIFSVENSSVFTFTGAQSLTDVRINNTATDGDPVLGFLLSGTTKFIMGVDDGDSDRFKIGTTAIGTNTRFTIDENGHVYLAALGRLYLDGGNDTYIVEDSANFFGVVTDGTKRLTVGNSLINCESAVDFSITATKKLLLDSNGDTGFEEDAADDMSINVGGVLSMRLQEIGTLTNIVLGKQAALATNVTDGFVYIPTSAGAPSGTPTAYTGKVALEFDTTNNDLYVYDGGWLKVAMAA